MYVHIKYNHSYLFVFLCYKSNLIISSLPTNQKNTNWSKQKNPLVITVVSAYVCACGYVGKGDGGAVNRLVCWQKFSLLQQKWISQQSSKSWKLKHVLFWRTQQNKYTNQLTQIKAVNRQVFIVVADYTKPFVWVVLIADTIRLPYDTWSYIVKNFNYKQTNNYIYQFQSF